MKVWESESIHLTYFIFCIPNNICKSTGTARQYAQQNHEGKLFVAKNSAFFLNYFVIEIHQIRKYGDRANSSEKMEKASCSLLSVKIIQITNLQKADLFSQSDCYVSLFLPSASFETAQTKAIKDCKNPVWNETFCYRIQNHVKNILELMVHDENRCLLDDQPFTVLFDVAKLQLGETICLTFPLDPKIQENLEVEFSLENIVFQVEKQIKLFVLLYLWIQCQWKKKQKELDVRLDYELCPDEQVFIQKRKKIVAAAMKRVLCMDNDLQDHEVPVVAIMATGGGARAFTAFHGHLLGLQKLNLLDCLTYISGSSGSSWTLSNLYEEPDWSQKDLLGPIADARKNMSKCKLDCFTLDHLKEYCDILKQRQKDGYKTCITDLWGLFIDQALGNGRCSSTLSEQKHALNHGQNPLPMYLVLNTRDKYSLQEFKEWMEFTPFEVGLLKYGAYIRAEDFGSKFFMGRVMKKIPESPICFMKGIWSNVFSFNLLDAWQGIDSSEDSFWYSYTQDKIKQIEEKPPLPPVAETVNTYLVTPRHMIMKIIRKVITERVSTSEVYNFLNGFQLNNGYLENKNFSIWKDTVLDTFPNQLMTPLEYLRLLDTVAFIDTSYAPLMKPERKVDVIIHLNYSSGSQTAPLDEASRYFAKQGIPFPKIDLSTEKNLKECYVFEDATDSKAPTVVFFPLINDTFRKYKAPGMKRGPTELKQGEVDLTSPLSPYGIQNFQYTEENFDKLINLTTYNIQNNKNSIIQALQRAIERKKHQTK
ncbi:cytosolic phospholipase A2 epsilon-like [Crotalus tigris]|uniref:cytosolic phospholipase A2 epsilon-like n=1 Tax=Crotalus tigris TaxID=88082 RepID=UPI00192F167A|nr:cytosolic phospholipase A2 epsilon-like [Crotalus tigris]